MTSSAPRYTVTVQEIEAEPLSVSQHTCLKVTGLPPERFLELVRAKAFPALPASLGNRHQESAPITKNEVKVLKARSHLGDLNPNKPGESTTNTGESTGSSDRLGGSYGAFCHPGADWILPFSGLVERLGRAAAEGSCSELRQAANDVVAAWQAVA